MEERRKKKEKNHLLRLISMEVRFLSHKILDRDAKEAIISIE